MSPPLRPPWPLRLHARRGRGRVLLVPAPGRGYAPPAAQAMAPARACRGVFLTSAAYAGLARAPRRG